MRGGEGRSTACQAQVDDFHDAGMGQEQVSGLDVPVDEPVLVRVLKPNRRLALRLHRRRPGEAGPRLATRSARSSPSNNSITRNRCEPSAPASWRADQVRTVELTYDDHFSLEAGTVGGIGRHAAQEYFQCDVALQSSMPGPINTAHAPLAERAEQLVLTKTLGNVESGHDRRHLIAREDPFHHGREVRPDSSESSAVIPHGSRIASTVASAVPP